METDFGAYLRFRCPRWNELPELELYMDQVVSVIERDLALFRALPAAPDADKEKTKEKDGDSAHLLTPTMINNYVKHRIIAPPVKKRYSREHLAYLHIICVGKRVLSMSEIRDALDAFLGSYTAEEAYDTFCRELEGALRAAFDPEAARPPVFGGDEVPAAVVMRAFAYAVAYKVYAQCILERGRPAQEEDE